MKNEKDLSRRDFISTSLVGVGTIAASQVGCGGSDALDGNTNLDNVDTVRTELEAYVTSPVQTDWAFCNRCASIFYNGKGTSLCPAGGPHNASSSGAYVINVLQAPGQSGWRWCGQCQSLAYHNNNIAFSGKCPGGANGHTLVDSPNYYVQFESTAGRPNGQTGWRFCQACSVLFYGPAGTQRCAAKTTAPFTHDPTGSGLYILMYGPGSSAEIYDFTVPPTNPHEPPPVNPTFTAVHAALLPVTPTQVLLFSGSNYHAPNHNAGLINHSYILDVAAAVISIPTNTVPTGHDMFCCGHTMLADGNLLVAGGTEGWVGTAGGHPLHWPGTRQATIFQPTGPTWVAKAPMLQSNADPLSGGRWYPTLLTRGNGNVLAFSGHPGSMDNRHSNFDVEQWDPGMNTWSVLTTEPQVVQLSAGISGIDPYMDNMPTFFTGYPEQYPRVHLLPNGTVFIARLAGLNTGTGQRADVSYRFDPTTLAWTGLCPAPPDNPPVANETYSPGYFFLGTTVLLPLHPPNYRAMVLYVGNPGAQTCDLGNNGSTNPTAWTMTPARKLTGTPYRRHCNAVLTPDGKVLVIGGVDTNKFDDSAATRVNTIEQFDPAYNTWTNLGALKSGRSYHTTALLLPSGSILIAGSSPKDVDRNPKVEIYDPPYLARGARPTITTISSTQFNYGSPRTITTPDSANIKAVTLVRVASTTHGFSSDQRCVELLITNQGASSFTVTVPSSSNVLPPGYYMLFLINHYGIPSVAKFVKVL